MELFYNLYKLLVMRLEYRDINLFQRTEKPLNTFLVLPIDFMSEGSWYYTTVILQ